MKNTLLTCCVVLAVAAAVFVTDSVADPEPADAHNKCEYRYIRGITHYEEVQRHNHHGPYIQSVPVYGPVWTNVCGISHGHWVTNTVCTVVGGGTGVWAGVNTAGTVFGIPLAPIVAITVAESVRTVCVDITTWVTH